MLGEHKCNHTVSLAVDKVRKMGHMNAQMWKQNQDLKCGYSATQKCEAWAKRGHECPPFWQTHTDGALLIPSIGFRGHFEGYVATLDSAFCTEMCQKSKSPTCLLFMCSTKQLIPSVLYIWIVLKALMEIETVELHQKNGNFRRIDWATTCRAIWSTVNTLSRWWSEHQHLVSIWSSGNRTSFLACPLSYS